MSLIDFLMREYNVTLIAKSLIRLIGNRRLRAAMVHCGGEIEGGGNVILFSLGNGKMIISYPCFCRFFLPPGRR